MDINAAVPSLLGQITSPNTEAIRSGELELKRLKKDPQIITALMGCLTNVQAPPAVRNVAAVMTRKYVHHHYATYPAEAQAGLKVRLREEPRTAEAKDVSCKVRLEQSGSKSIIPHSYIRNPRMSPSTRPASQPLSPSYRFAHLRPRYSTPLGTNRNEAYASLSWER